MDSFARCPTICCCWVEERLNPFRLGRIDCETYQELILIAGWIIGSDVISRVSTITPRLEHEMILLAKKEGNEGEHVAWEESVFNAGIVASRHYSSKWTLQVVESTEYYSKRDSYKGSKPVTADGDGTEWRPLSEEPSADRTYGYEGKQTIME
ncbi:hypothetical protein L1987_40833 [Smallanthus sonchifolius]|uniref:Uncharacterized protein n=1 Tax=Smallanthus sonchifolius TaxID=185202 RepID=A0ACB9GV44_9ASTR|nr:hypothetical protein L1987_40833 [Smallanthus sonchifolius]